MDRRLAAHIVSPRGRDLVMQSNDFLPLLFGVLVLALPRRLSVFSQRGEVVTVLPHRCLLYFSLDALKVLFYFGDLVVASRVLV